MMRIDSLSTNPDRAGKYRLQLSDGTIVKAYAQTISDFGLYSGMEMTAEEFSDFMNAVKEMSAKMRAVRIVAATGVSKRELEQRLIHKGETPKDAKKAVQWMTDLDLLDDKKTAQQIVSNCIHKGYGLARAKQTLYEKRIPKELWAEVLEDYPDQMDKILSYLRSKLPEQPTTKDIQRTIDALSRRGHNYGRIKQALSQLSFDSDDFLEA